MTVTLIGLTPSGCAPHVRTGRVRILHVVPHVSIGGLWRHLQCLSLGDASHEHSIISIFDLNDPLAVAALGPPLVELRIPLAQWLDEKWIRNVLDDYMRFLRPDVIHTYHPFADFYSIPVAMTHGCKIIRSVLGVSQVTWANPFSHRDVRTTWSFSEIRRQLAVDPYVYKTLTVSQSMKAQLTECGFDPKKIEVVYFGTGLGNNAVAGPGNPGREKQFRIGYLHRLEPIKMPHRMVRIVGSLIDRGIPTQVVLFQHGRLCAQTLDDLKNAGLSHHVELFNACADPWAVVGKLNAMLITSEHEGLPLTIYEAMGQGVPVVSSDVGGVPELVVHGDTGLLYSRDDCSAAADCLELIWSDQEFANAIRNSGNHRVQRLTLQQHVNTLTKLYCDAVGACVN